tara:strand:+ start:291 stop:824 length:534 start_codon:yes stop_codon:yes gene_type:complete
MVIFIGGIPCSGKSTLMRELISRFGSSKLIEPMPLFKCQEYDNILVCGQYPEGETFGGTDKLSYGAIPKFREFVDYATSNYKHTIIEGDRFFRAEDIEWVLDNHEAEVYILTVPLEEEKRRHLEREDTQTEKWLEGRRSQINNIQKNFNLMGRINVRVNDSMQTSKDITDDIYGKVI